MQADSYSILEGINQKCIRMSAAHKDRARSLTCRSNTLKSIIGIITLALSAQSTSDLTNSQMPDWVRVLFNVLMIVLASLQTLFAKLNYAEQIAKHKTTQSSFQNLSADITLYLVRDPESRTRKLIDEVEFAVSRYNTLDEEAPELSTSPCFDDIKDRPSPISIKLEAIGTPSVSRV